MFMDASARSVAEGGSMGAMPTMHLHGNMHLHTIYGADFRNLVWALLRLYVECKISSL
jgi:hypothetical protein